MIKSIYQNQGDILRNIRDLHLGGNNFECDLTYGNGCFWKGLEMPPHRFDIDPQFEHVTKACSTDLPLFDRSVNNVVFDPPFLTYVRAKRNGNGNMAFARRYSGYWRYDELVSHYRRTLKESARVLKPLGILVFKCQDIIHNHQMHCTHANIIQWASEFGFRLRDLFILAPGHRMPSPNRAGRQRHARIYHSYFLVLERSR